MKLKLVISDFHLSAGKWLPDGRRNPLEDFYQDRKFAEFLDYYSSGKHERSDVELIVNGDFFDPLAIVKLSHKIKIIEGEYPLEVEEPEAVNKFKIIFDGHPTSFQAMRDFLNKGKKITFRWGNHDASLLWPKVQDFIREALDPPKPEQIEFQMKPYIFDRICVDHGHQFETIHHFDEANIFIDRKTKDGVKRIQNLPFGSFFVMLFLNKIKLKKDYINQVHPFGNYLKVSLFLTPYDFVVEGLGVLWFFFKMRFITHPMRFARFRKTLKILKEIIHRPPLEEAAEKILTGAGSEKLSFDTMIMGHNHAASVRIFPGGKQYINTGTWTPITSLELATLGHRVSRTYAHIEYKDGKPRASLRVWHGNPQPSDEFT